MPGQSFSGFSREAVTFLKDLKDNNNKDWFAANKKTYESEIKAPAEEFCKAVAGKLNALTKAEHSYKVFRIYRDVRFSKDKTPYNAHLHISFTPESKLASPPMWFFGLGTEQLSLGCGVFGFDNEALDAFRNRIVGADGAKIARTMDKLAKAGVRIGEPHLKRVPGGYPKDHPNAQWLLYKGLNCWVDYSNYSWVSGSDMVSRCMKDFTRLKPVYDLLIDG